MSTRSTDHVFGTGTSSATARVTPHAPAGKGAAELAAPFVSQLFAGRVPIRFVCWDGSAIGPSESSARVIIRDKDVLRRLVWSPHELGLARAYVTGGIDVEGDLVACLPLLRDRLSARRLRPWLELVRTTARMSALRGPLASPVEEARLSGRRHSRRRDASAVVHHYDVSNDFYRLLLGASMTYSCARFTDETTSIDGAQAAKHDLVCRKLGLDERPGLRLLDVGCGWGSMVIHAAQHYGAQVVGITLSPAQKDLALARAAESGVGAQVEIRLQDYRELSDERFDAISSIGMFEHVGTKNMRTYFSCLHRVLGPTGRLLNHAISKSKAMRRKSRFIDRYVFPDGELIDVGDVLLAMESAGFEVRDVETLREHYVRTLEHWRRMLEERWDQAVALVGEVHARAWRLYLAGSAYSFREGAISVQQVLATRPGPTGESGMPATRANWL